AVHGRRGLAGARPGDQPPAEEHEREDGEHGEEQPLQPLGADEARRHQHADQQRAEPEEQHVEGPGGGEHLQPEQPQADQHPHPPVHGRPSVSQAGGLTGGGSGYAGAPTWGVWGGGSGYAGAPTWGVWGGGSGYAGAPTWGGWGA